jgi:stage II sporulation protein D
MKKFLLRLFFLVTFCVTCAVSACAVTNGMVKVGLKYGENALFSANLENDVGSGYSFGFYDDSRFFNTLGYTDRTAISMTAAGNIYIGSSGAYYGSVPISGYTELGKYHVQLGSYGSYEEAASAAAGYGGYPAYISGAFYARIGCYASESEASAAMSSLGVSGTVVSGSSTGVMVTVTKTATVLFEFDYQGAQSLAVLPQGGDTSTWFKGYRYRGGFQYDRVTGGNLNVSNVVDLENYVKGVIPYEMSGTWPSEALKAQAVCARTYVCGQTKHAVSYGFDVCNTTDCQVYYGIGNATAVSDAAVDETAGQQIYYNGSPIGINAVYFSCDGGATEDAKNVWGSEVGYLIGKQDPYEATISIPNYSYSVSYTSAQLTWVLQNSGYSIGNIANVYVSGLTNLGNVNQVTFVDTAGKTLTVSGEKCRTAFYSTTYGKSVRSMRFTINGGSGGSSGYNVNGTTALGTLNGVSVISGSGTVGTLNTSAPHVITSSGTSALTGGSTASSGSSSGTFTITGTGNGHNVGMSQYGACAMAQQGSSYLDILNFYYTNVTVA